MGVEEEFPYTVKGTHSSYIQANPRDDDGTLERVLEEAYRFTCFLNDEQGGDFLAKPHEGNLAWLYNDQLVDIVREDKDRPDFRVYRMPNAIYIRRMGLDVVSNKDKAKVLRENDKNTFYSYLKFLKEETPELARVE